MLGVEPGDRLVAVARDGGPVSLQAPAGGAEPEQWIASLRQQLPPTDDVALWVALTPPAVPELPAELLAQARAQGYAVQGFADRAALLAAWLPGITTLVSLTLSRRQFAISVAVRDADAASLRRHVALPGGEQALHDAWLRLAAATLVQRTRFDPLHDLRHEAALRARLPALAAAAQQDGQSQCDVETGQGSTLLALTRDQFVAAAAPVYAPLSAALQALSAAHGDALLLVPDSLLTLPGLAPALAGARFARLCHGADDLAARAASLLLPSGVSGEGGVPYRTRLPLARAAAPDGLLHPLAATSAGAQAMATHVVFGGRVLPITSQGLVLGRAPGGIDGLQLPEGVAGLSRRHCTLRRDGARTQVIDHSTHGTFVDGGRVRGRALLPAGATLRLGDPGIELPLVAIDPA